MYLRLRRRNSGRDIGKTFGWNAKGNSCRNLTVSVLHLQNYREFQDIVNDFEEILCTLEKAWNSGCMIVFRKFIKKTNVEKETFFSVVLDKNSPGVLPGIILEVSLGTCIKDPRKYIQMLYWEVQEFYRKFLKVFYWWLWQDVHRKFL